MSNLPAIDGGSPVRPRDRFLVFGAPAIGEEEIAGVVDSMRRRWIGTGPKVEQFERNFAEYKGAPHAVAVGSCTAALHLSILALDLQPGDEVITTAMTFCSTVNAIIHSGATPVLADCDKSTINITAESIAEKIGPRTKAVVVVHMCGRVCEMDDIMVLARAHGLAVVEDCAHAVEASYNGVAAGLIGDIGCFSFYATKNLTTAEGGMILTADEHVAGRIKRLALHGLSTDAWQRFSDSGYRHYYVEDLGFKYNMTDIQAAIGLEQLKKLDRHAAHRSRIWQKYLDAFADLPCILPPGKNRTSRHAHHLFTPLLDLDQLRVPRDHILAAMTAENIGIGVHYLPVHLHRYYTRTLGVGKGSFPNAEYVGERTISLPLSGALEDQDVESVITAFRRLLTYYRR